jgi:hypothetical protein
VGLLLLLLLRWRHVLLLLLWDLLLLLHLGLHRLLIGRVVAHHVFVETLAIGLDLQPTLRADWQARLRVENVRELIIGQTFKAVLLSLHFRFGGLHRDLRLDVHLLGRLLLNDLRLRLRLHRLGNRLGLWHWLARLRDLSGFSLFVAADLIGFLSLCFLFILLDAAIDILLEFATFAHC